MKKSLTTIALVVGLSLSTMHAAKADVVARAKGQRPDITIALLDTNAGCTNRPGFLEAAVYDTVGNVVTGCWNRVSTGNGAMVNVIWEDGERSLYPETTTWMFTPRGIAGGFMHNTPQSDAQKRRAATLRGEYL